VTTIPPSYPEKFSFYAPISVRYADLDPQRHVNNIAVLEYVETARTGYYQASGIWDGKTVENMGMVVASVKCDYISPIQYGQAVRVGILRLSWWRMTNKPVTPSLCPKSGGAN